MMNKNLQEITRKMRELRLPTMTNQLSLMVETGEIHSLNPIEVVERLVDEEYISRKNNAIVRLKKNAKLSDKMASVEGINYDPKRNASKEVISQLLTNDYVRKARNVLVLGACGTGKSYITNALANHACENHYTTRYCRAFEFFHECHIERINTGGSDKTVEKFAKYDVLILDDFLISTPSETESAQLFKLIEYRYKNKATIIGSQLEPSEWHSRLGGGILADAIIDRLASGAYKLVLSGDSLRK